MIQHRVSSIVLTRSDAQPDSKLLYPVGMITERDIVQYQALELDLPKVLAESVMSAPLFHIHPSDPLLGFGQLGRVALDGWRSRTDLPPVLPAESRIHRRLALSA